MKARCDKCNGTGSVEQPYLAMLVIPDILRQTPKSVWEQYRVDGYTLRQAIDQELSYAD